MHVKRDENGNLCFDTDEMVFAGDVARDVLARTDNDEGAPERKAYNEKCVELYEARRPK